MRLVGEVAVLFHVLVILPVTADGLFVPGMAVRVDANAVFRKIRRAHVVTDPGHRLRHAGEIARSIIPAEIAVLRVVVRPKLRVEIPLEDAVVRQAHEAGRIQRLGIGVQAGGLIDNPPGVQRTLEVFLVSPAVQLVPHAPEHDGGVIVQVPDHLRHLAVDVLEIDLRRPDAADVHPRNLCLDDDAHPVAKPESVVVVRVVRQPEEVTAELADGLVIAVIVLIGQCRRLSVHVLVHAHAPERVRLPVQGEPLFPVDGIVPEADLRHYVIVPGGQFHRIEIRVLHAVPQMRVLQRESVLVGPGNIVFRVLVDHLSGGVPDLQGNIGLAVERRLDSHAGRGFGDIFLRDMQAVWPELGRVEIDVPGGHVQPCRIVQAAILVEVRTHGNHVDVLRIVAHDLDHILPSH